MTRDQTYLIDIATTCQTVLELVQGMNQLSFVVDKGTYRTRRNSQAYISRI